MKLSYLISINVLSDWLCLSKWLFYIFITDKLCKVLKFAINEMDGDFI